MILMEKGGQNIFGSKSTVQSKTQDQGDSFSNFLMGGQADKVEKPTAKEQAQPALADRGNIINSDVPTVVGSKPMQ